MNFILFENENGNDSFAWENELESLPDTAIAFTYYQQDCVDEIGFVQSHEYRIGIPVRFILGDMYIKLDSNITNSQEDDIYCLYVGEDKRKFIPINSNTTLVNSFSELENVFTTVIKKRACSKEIEIKKRL